ncbi:4-alpha-glucanotransferase [cyanobiont of Ornithocercus magnificus]|nr:4-alpha-glucanotransferase [cyanobiont of Ornithocercus magnificus]
MHQRQVQRVRSSGILLHPTALPGSPVCGTLGQPARDWINSLHRHNTGVWQVLPLAPPDSTGSPYSSPSSFALNPWLLDAMDLVDEGFLTTAALLDLPGEDYGYSAEVNTLDFSLAQSRALALASCLQRFWEHQSQERKQVFTAWSARQPWLEDHVSFMELRRQHGDLPWWEWPKPFARRCHRTLREWALHNQSLLLAQRLLQWHLDRQWQAIRRHAAEQGILLFGDLPFYVARDSSDVWSQPHLFSIQSDGSLHSQSGVPPDYFSSTGQLWGTPVYRWQRHQSNRFTWWRNRLNRQWQLVDLLRLDHFRALASYWCIPGKNVSAQKGNWHQSPGYSLLSHLRNDILGSLPIVAEDLGIITPEVEDLRDQFSLPGMKILQFAFDGNPDNPYLPENIHGPRWVVYTGTHDNPTSISWWNNLDQQSKSSIISRVGRPIVSPGWQLLELGLASNAALVITPLQDLLHLDDRARFNTPGTVCGNWCWRLHLQITDQDLQGALQGYGERSRAWDRSRSDACKLVAPDCGWPSQ